MPGSVDVVFTRSHSIGAIAIRAVTWSSWSHCALVLADGSSAIEAVWPEGVRYTTVEKIRARATQFERVRVAVPSPAACWLFASRQVGRPYDVMGVVGLGLRREWQDESSWWCSEHVAASISEGGRVLFSRHAHRVTPEHLWMVL